MREGLDQAEQQTSDQLRPQLVAHVAVCERVLNTIGLTLDIALEAISENRVSQVSISRRVAMNLMVRLSNDIRCVWLLTAQGYALQAASLVSSIYEIAHCIAFIGADDARAQAWVDHADPARPFQPAWNLTNSVVRSLDDVKDPEGFVNRAYRMYSNLCQAKHANPLLQKQFGHYATDEFVVVMSGPEASDQAIALAKSSLKSASQLALIGLASFFDSHAPEARSRLDTRVQAIRSEIDSLGNA